MDISDPKDGTGSFGESAMKYVSLKLEGCKYRWLENFAVISNKILVVLVAIMIGVVILQLAGIALAFVIGWMVNSIVLGFVLTAIIFALALVAVYVRRETLFLPRISRMYSKMFFGEEIADIKKAREENALRRQMGQMELQAAVLAKVFDFLKRVMGR